MIDGLIDKKDNFEIIRDQIGMILATEAANQQVMAAQRGLDPTLWALKVYSERSAPWEDFLNIDDPSEDASLTPIVNVWFETDSFNGQASNLTDRQDMQGTFNIDSYGCGISRANGQGHLSGDRQAAIAAQRATKLVRNILMAGTYRYLGLRGTVNERRIQSRTAFQPGTGSNPTQQIVAMRLALNVRYNEFSPQVTGQPLEYVHIDVNRQEDGGLYFAADYDHTSGD